MSESYTETNDNATELLRLRKTARSANARVQVYADQVARLVEENDDLRAKLRANQNQMRIMRHSAVWRAGGVFRRAKRMAGVVVRNVIGMVRG